MGISSALQNSDIKANILKSDLLDAVYFTLIDANIKTHPAAQSGIPSLPLLEDTVAFTTLTYVTEGTHATIYQATISDGEDGDDMIFCLKLFRQGWMTPFNLEKSAYECLRAADVKECIPEVYGYAARTLVHWGVSEDTQDDELYYGILMEWLSGAEGLSVQNITMSYACRLLEALDKIHKAGVLHFDPFRRNQMVFPGTRRVVWIDFSCAHLNEEYAHAYEIGDVGGILFELVFIPSGFANL